MEEMRKAFPKINFLRFKFVWNLKGIPPYMARI